MKKVTITQDENDVVEIEVLAKAIKDISDSMKKLLKTPLKRKTIILLIQDSIPKNERVTKTAIDSVLSSIEYLAKNHLNKY